MKRIILFTFFLTSLCVHSFGKDKFESPNHQLSAEVNGQSVTLYDKSKQMVTRIHLGFFVLSTAECDDFYLQIFANN